MNKWILSHIYNDMLYFYLLQKSTLKRNGRGTKELKEEELALLVNVKNKMCVYLRWKNVEASPSITSE